MTQTPHQECKVIGCSSEVRSREYCALHYDRWIKSGRTSPGPTEKIHASSVKGLICQVDDCDRPVRCKNLCSIHYDRAKRKKDICPSCNGPKQKASATCKNCYIDPFKDSPTEKECPGCKTIKPIDNFGTRKKSDSIIRYRSRCKQCENAYAKQRREKILQENPDYFKIQKKKSDENLRRKLDNDPELRTLKSLMKSATALKVDKDAVLERWESVGNNCESCGRSGTYEKNGRVFIDHCHSTGLFRGLLCGQCNTAAGMLGDNAEKAEQLAAYLTKPIIQSSAD